MGRGKNESSECYTIVIVAAAAWWSDDDACTDFDEDVSVTVSLDVFRDSRWLMYHKDSRGRECEWLRNANCML
jgi:hypothetical protein